MKSGAVTAATVWRVSFMFFVIFITKISRFARFARFFGVLLFDTQSGVWHPHFELSRFRKSLIYFLPPDFPGLPLSRSCQTPQVINPSVVLTAMVLRNSINKTLSDGHVLSIIVHKQLVHICHHGHMELMDRSGGGGITLSKLGYQLFKREVFVMQICLISVRYWSTTSHAVTTCPLSWMLVHA